MAKNREAKMTKTCSRCGEVTFKHTVVPLTNDAGEEYTTILGDVFDFGKCKVAKEAEIPNYPNEVELLYCPFYLSEFK